MRVDDDLIVSSQKERKLESLEKRNKDRLTNIETANEKKSKHLADDEDQDYFQLSFLNQSKQIENNLNNLPTNNNQLTTSFKDIAGSIQELQNYLTASAFFLPHYNVKIHQATINNLRGILEQKKTTLIPKKKFGFKVKLQPATTDHVDNGKMIDSSVTIPKTTTKPIEWTVESRSKANIVLDCVTVNNKDITISSLTDSVLQIQGHPGSLQLSNLSNCLIVCGPVARSVFAENCHNCIMAFGCQQFRFHSSVDCMIYLHVTCRAIIEDCRNIGMAPYNYDYVGIDIDFMKAGLDMNRNRWEDVGDFNWLSLEKHSPNWHIISSDDRISKWDEVIGDFIYKNYIS